MSRESKLYFNEKIYTKKAIAEAVEAWSAMADFKVENKEKYCIVSIDNIDMNAKENFKEEFCNYVLNLL